MEAHRQRVASCLALAGVALATGRDAAIAAQLAGTLAACAPLRDALRFGDDPDAWHVSPLPPGAAAGKTAGQSASSGAET